jgi:uncharacterized membrane protein
MKKFKVAIISLILLAFVFAGISFAFLSDIIPIHFGINGDPDQFGSKYFILIFPSVISIVGISMLLVCRYANVSENYQKYMLLTGVVLEVILNAILVLFLAYALTYSDGNATINISKIMLPLCGAMFIILGNFMPKVEKNSTLGVKTRWSKYNETTWQKTHRFTGFVSVIIGALAIILSFFFNDLVNFIILMSLIAVFGISTTVASYIYYKEEKAKELQNN